MSALVLRCRYHLWVDYRDGQLETAYPSFMMISVYIVWNLCLASFHGQSTWSGEISISNKFRYMKYSKLVSDFIWSDPKAWGTYSLYTLALQQVGTFNFMHCHCISFFYSNKIPVARGLFSQGLRTGSRHVFNLQSSP